MVHAPHRLRICAMLNAAQKVEFSVILDHLGLSASVLSKQISYLVDAGYVNQHRAVGDSRRVWLEFTPTGQAAYRSHIAALRAIVDEAEPTELTPSPSTARP